ncbi:hypothetical protein [Mycolicibacterium sarraceniae]|uniref:PASTA domain-containing protein n=1 Tax=Mycolicibacterium sarraceniae TaxID=1534348 RepID=A0A7I7SXD0_9MYCO|nr:hypothetical protein [Mycolicibacterium sarraceniae]BBY60869.1 hypothetical protein MSAR_40050 [Mycolicibacterium sarraceniae]
MTNFIRIGFGTVALGAVSLTLGSVVAQADDYAGKSYADASAAISSAGQKAVIASSVGDGVSQSDCVVTHSQKAPWLKGDNFSPVTNTVLLYLNCDAKLAKAGTPGNSLASPEGRAEKAAEDAQAAKQAAAQQAAAQQAAAQQNEATQLVSPGGN